MVNKTHKRLRNIVLLAFALGLAAGVGVATGAIPGSDGAIHGCYTKVGGVLRVIDTGTTSGCTRFETGLNWNQTGPQGPGSPGPAGQAGANGTNGTNGTNGVSGYEVVTASSAFTTDSSKTQDVSCPSGKVPIAGGINTSLPVFAEQDRRVLPDLHQHLACPRHERRPDNQLGTARFRNLRIRSVM